MIEDRGQQKKYIVWLPFLLALMVVIGMLVGIRIGKSGQSLVKVIASEKQEGAIEASVDEVIRFVEARYVDSIDGGDLRTAAIKAVIDKLDPHTYYINAEKVARMNETMHGNFEGIGVEFWVFDDTINILHVFDQGPAEKAGIQVGDQVLFAADSSLAGVGLSIPEIISILKGPAETSVKVRIKRHGIDSLIATEIHRGQINVPSISTVFNAEKDIVFIKIDRFTSHTYGEFMKALEPHQEDGSLKHLIIDLRNNPGGYLQEAVKILSQFFDQKGELLVYTEGKAAKKADYKSTGKKMINVKNIAVLINEGSASASEIIAGSLQDLDRAVIVGRRSFGKGLVQEQYDLQDGGALRLTVSRYFTPSGRLIQRGYEDPKDYNEELANRMKSGELFVYDSMEVDEGAGFQTSSGREVLAGNGIIPDIFIPLDSIMLNDCYEMLYGMLEEFGLKYYRNHPDRFGNVQELEEFFASDKQSFKDLISEVEGFECAGKDAILERKKDLRQAMTAFMAKYYFGKYDFYRIMLFEDPGILESIKAISEDNPVTALRN